MLFRHCPQCHVHRRDTNSGGTTSKAGRRSCSVGEGSNHDREGTKSSGKFPKISLAKPRAPRNKSPFFETGGHCPSSTQPSVREPREIRGRLRHCNGLQTPRATGSPTNREGGSEVQAPSQDIGLVVLVMAAVVGRASRLPKSDRRPACHPAKLLRQEKDEASLSARAAEEPLNAFILRLPGLKVFCCTCHVESGFAETASTHRPFNASTFSPPGLSIVNPFRSFAEHS